MNRADIAIILEDRARCHHRFTRALQRWRM